MKFPPVSPLPRLLARCRNRWGRRWKSSPHDITIRAKGLFNPWRKVFNRRTLEPGGHMQETQFY